MGMDVIGAAPHTQEGRHFRNNIWWWRPLWEYCREVAPDLVGRVSGDTNDGDGLEHAEAADLASRLEKEIADGRCKNYEEQYAYRKSQMPLLVCDLCGGTGIRTDEVGRARHMPEKKLEPTYAMILGRDAGWCNGCGGEGKHEDWRSAYSFSESNVEAFARFCRSSGGFMIY